MTQLASLAQTVARLRETQQQAARASAARHAAEQLLHHVNAVSAAPGSGTGTGTGTNTGWDRAAYFPHDLKTDRVVLGRAPAPTRATAAEQGRGQAPRRR